jgi:peroxiredoxin Q/BCP
MELSAGSIAPNFTVSIGKDSFFTLMDQRGKKVILYFYPKDNTPGCTQEACDFRDSFPKFSNKNCIIIGISKDSSNTHEIFSQKHALPFYLGSDPTGEILEKYGVLVEKSMYGRMYKGIERTTFLINERGRIENVWRHVKVKNHIQEILKCLSTTI